MVQSFVNTTLSGVMAGDQMELKQLLTITDFTAQYSLSRTSLYREVMAGRLRLTKVGRRSFIAIEDAQTWLQNLRKSDQSSIN
jgi:hypothetical protein